jgi:predicted regulator of Ras-like GTPase activity (Roadblock/LC7/MglB family)
MTPSQDLQWLLASFADRVPGVTHAVALSGDGLTVAASQSVSRDQADRMAAIAAGLVSLSYGASRCLEGGPMVQTIIEMANGFLLFMSMSNNSSLAVLAERDSNIGEVGYEMAVLASRAGETLAPQPRSTACAFL